MAFDLNTLSKVQIGLASPEMIVDWSYGEIINSETINYRTQKPVEGGLFSQKVFGPYKDFECACGKYKKIKDQGVICEKCQTLVTYKSVRRERMGHIELAAPCTHIWYLKGTPNRIAFLLDVQPKALEEVCYYSSRICLTAGNCKKIKKHDILDEKAGREKLNEILHDLKNENIITDEMDRAYCDEFISELSDAKNPFSFEITANFINKYTGIEFGIGAEAIKRLLDEFDVEGEYKKVEADLFKLLENEKAKDREGKTNKSQKKEKLVKRLEVIKSFYDSKQKPSWMILTNLPIIPPDLRPMLQLDGGRFAASDLNDLYRRVINRNIRLKKFYEIKGPTPIIINEKRMLQDAVDSLIDNGKKSKPVTASNNRTLKSLTSFLKGKQGRFRQNLLGKRVDYSGRSVIAVGPTLKMNQCGIPREMAIQLFRPFICHELIKNATENGEKAMTHKKAEELINKYDKKVLDIIEKIIKDHPVLLNRAPTLHRLGIQAFEPILVEGRAIRLHPLVCTGFNADFDGDQMAVHIPLSDKARAEARELMIANHNILGPKDGKPICIPTQDMVLGNYYLTMEASRKDFDSMIEEAKSFNDTEKVEQLTQYRDLEGKVFGSIQDVKRAFNNKQIHLHNRILIKGSNIGKYLDESSTREVAPLSEEQLNSYLVTTVGKLLFNSVLPYDFPYINDADMVADKVNNINVKETLDDYFIKFVNGKVSPLSKKEEYKKLANLDLREFLDKLPLKKPVGKSALKPIINEVFLSYGADETSVVLDNVKDLGFETATIAGFTVAFSDILPVEGKEEELVKGDALVAKIESAYEDGLYSDEGRHNAITEVWDNVKNEVTKKLKVKLNTETRNPVFMMANSGARGSTGNFVSLLGVRGLHVNPKGETIEIPIRSNFIEGANVSEFFIASHGARKGGTDTALKTADSGYLTRRLIDVSHNVIIREEDCHCDHGIMVSALYNEGETSPIEKLKDRLVGRYNMRDIVLKSRTIPANTLLNEIDAEEIENEGIKEVEIRSVLTCEAKVGICAHCYGRNMATAKPVEIGDAVGIMAAQSIGEPGTQLTLKNFHTGGTTGSDITQGLPRVQELLEARVPKGEANISPISGTITQIITNPNNTYEVTIENQDSKGNVIESQSVTTFYGTKLRVKEGDYVEAGDQITAGAVDPRKLLEYSDFRKVQNYIIKEVQNVYSSQGIELADKHLEVIVRQMCRKGVIVDGGTTSLVPGMRCDIIDLTEANEQEFLKGKNAKPARLRPILLGITKAALDTKSFLSSASFQETTKVLTDAAVKSKVDNLVGLKENVMVGKLIPAGTGVTPLDIFKDIDSQYDDETSTKRVTSELGEEYDISDSDKETLSEVSEEMLSNSLE